MIPGCIMILLHYDLQVKLGPRPWHERWERRELKGVQDLGLPEKFYKRAAEVAKPWEKHDLMLQHRTTIADGEAQEIMEEVAEGIKRNEAKRRQQRLEESKS